MPLRTDPESSDKIAYYKRNWSVRPTSALLYAQCIRQNEIECNYLNLPGVPFSSL